MFLQITNTIGIEDSVANLNALISDPIAGITEEKMPIFELALQGGWIMIPLLLLLLICTYVFVERLVLISRASKFQPNFMGSIRDCVFNGRLDSAKTLCVNTNTPIAKMIEKGISRIGRPLNDINTAIENVGKLEVAKLEKNLAWLSTTSGAAPMIGFLGTVIGMVKVFFDIASKGNNIDVGVLADGMYQAMVTTVGGLIVGIIAYVAYNFLVAKIEKLVYNMEARATEFMDLLHEPAK